LLEIIDYIFGFILWLSGYFFLLLVWLLFFGLLFNIGDKFDDYKKPRWWAMILTIIGGCGMCLTPILVYLFPIRVRDLVTNVLFGGGDVKFSIAFNHVVGFVSTWIKSPSGAFLVSVISFLAWFIGLISGTISIYEFFSKRFRNQNKKGIR